MCLFQFSGGCHIPEKSSSMRWEELRPGPAWETLNHLSQPEVRKKYRNIDFKTFIPLWKLERQASFFSTLSGMLPAHTHKKIRFIRDYESLSIYSLHLPARELPVSGTSEGCGCSSSQESERLHTHLFPQRCLVHTQWPVRGEARAPWGTLTSCNGHQEMGSARDFYLCHTGQKICPTLVPRGIHLLFPKWRQTCSYAWTLKSRGITLYLPRLSTVQVSVWKKQFRIQGSRPQKGELSPQWLPSFSSRPFCASLPVPLLMTPIQMHSF